MGDVGVQYLSDAFRHNKVNVILYYFYFDLFIQTLITLNLANNNIGIQGSQYLAYAFKKRKVKLTLNLSTYSNFSHSHVDTHRNQSLQQSY